MAGNLITSLLSLATQLLPSIIASAQARSSSSSNSNNSEKERAHVAEENFERLMQTLEQIKAMLYDAQEREIRDHSVKELKKVAYSSHKRQQIEELSILSDIAMAEEVPETALTQEIPDAALTKALLEKFTQLVLLQQTAVQPPPLQHAPATEGLLQSSPISVKLDGANYVIWSQATEMYVKERDKLKHIKGDVNPPRPGDPLYQKWDIDDSVVKGWLLNSLHEKLFVNFNQYPTARDVWDAIATTFYNGNDTAQVFDLNKRVTRLKQSGRGVEEYYNELQTLWREIDFRRPNPMIHIEDIEKFNGFIQETRVYTFLDGLDDRLDNVRADVLQMSPFPTVEQAYDRVRKEATPQGIMMKGGEDITHESVAMMSKGYKQPMVNLSLNKNISSLDKSKPKCTYCGGMKHVRKNCFKLTGNYPDWWKEPKKKFSSKGRVNSVNFEEAHANPNLVSSASIQYPNSKTSQPMQSTMQHGSSFDPEVGRVGTKSASAQCVAATGSGSGSLCLTSDIENMGKKPGNFFNSTENLNIQRWVVDSRATDHMTYSSGDLVNLKQPQKKGIFNANGIAYPVQGAGDVSLSHSLTLKNTLLVPSLATKLISVGQLTEELNCYVQDILTKKILGRGIKRDGLYYLDDPMIGKTCLAQDDMTKLRNRIWLWHKRLGHLSFGYMRKFFPHLFLGLNNEEFNCETCVKAKSHRTIYPNSLSKSSFPFD